MFGNLYRGRKVLVTGHTGFKGSWLVFWLRQLGAEVCGVALPMPGGPDHFRLLAPQMESHLCDIRNQEALKRIFSEFQPEAVFHLAAQPLVRRSYRDPAETFSTNVTGTVNLLEACRATPSVRAVVAVTSDKCYENREELRPYAENEPMGGYDPYSASKGCAELVISSYRRSFFHPERFGDGHRVLLASARAGNVVGGGDWAEDRLIPDLMKAAAAGKTAEIRNPAAVRPWQHVLEPLGGYLLLGQKLLEGDVSSAEGWNFGPADDTIITVGEAARALAAEWDAVKLKIDPPASAVHEAGVLRLDCSKARSRLHWRGVWTPAETFRRTVEWYRDFYRSGRINTGRDLEEYAQTARKEGMEWTK